jgi:hypothetical protein
MYTLPSPPRCRTSPSELLGPHHRAAGSARSPHRRDCMSTPQMPRVSGWCDQKQNKITIRFITSGKWVNFYPKNS